MYQLIYYPADILRQKAHDVRDFDRARLTDITTNMRRIMHDYNGMGLAAPQIGISERIIVVEYPGDEKGKGAIPFTVLVNPKIISHSKDHDSMHEGCLSVPYVEVLIERPLEIVVSAQTIEGEPLKLKAKGIFARIIQHEIDHINGTLIIDYDKQEQPDKHHIRTIVWGSTEFTTGVLNTIRPDFTVTHIVTEPAKPSGRNQTLTSTVVKQYADTLSIPTIEPLDLLDPLVYNYLLSCKPDIMIVAAYGRLIPENLFTIPRFGTLNVHPSLLPKYRGATPIQAALLAGDKQTGVTIMKLASKFDTGDIVAQAPYDLDGTETYTDLETNLAELGGECLREIITPYMRRELELMPQNELKASTTKKITKEDCWLNMNDPALLNERKVRAYSPDPGAFVMINGQPMKILKAHIDDKTLVFDLVQPAGRTPMTWQQFLNGYRQDLKFEPYKSIMNKDSSSLH